MSKFSISQLAGITGRDRRTVTDRLQGLDFTEGDDNAHLYESEPALEAIYLGGVNTLDAARTQLAVRQASFTQVREEELRKERIPLDLVKELLDAQLQSFGAQLKAAKGKFLTIEVINDLLGGLRSMKLPLKW